MRSPVLFLVFNRPDTTQRVFETIRGGRPPRLYVAADGPRADRLGEREHCDQVRSIVTSVDWPCEVKTLFRNNNLGCKIAVSSAIDWFFAQEAEGIILEDDVLPSGDFFPFCDEVLERYRDDTRVMMATGTNYLSEPTLNYPYFFSQHFTIWGWATWRRAWKEYDVSMAKWRDPSIRDNIAYMFQRNYIWNHFCATFNSLGADYVDTWDIQWVFACLINGGLCAVPKVNLVSNIGVDGTHSGALTDSHFLKTYDLGLKLTAPQPPVMPRAAYDESLHLQKTRPALRRRRLVSLLKLSGLYEPIKAARGALKSLKLFA